MPIESPQLDDLRFNTVFEQLQRLIPVYAPEWTDHNESDPGIAMLQLFAHLSEQLGYRLNQLPDKAYVEMLKLVGVTLKPAEPARTSLAFYLSRAEQATAFLIQEGAKVRAKSKSGAPPTFETTQAVEGVPAQVVALITTRHDDLRDVLFRDPVATTDTAATLVAPRFSLVWDGRQPKLKDWPERPVHLFSRPDEATHATLWLGLAFNPLPSAGLVGQRVSLSIFLDDDEQPFGAALADCSLDLEQLVEAMGRPTEAVYYRPAQPGESAGTLQPLRVLSDSTLGLIRSGQLRFDVPPTLGPIPKDEWRDVRRPAVKTLADICAEASSGSGASTLAAAIPHPLIGALKTAVAGTPPEVPVSGWLGLRFATPPGSSIAVRAITFNAAPAVAAVTATNELLGRGNNRSDQRVKLVHGNVVPGSLQLVVQDPVRRVYELWSQVDDFDTAGPDERVYLLDAEAGIIYFGDGIHGRVPGLDAPIVAVRYRWGGGENTELAAGTVTQGENLPTAIQDVTNPIPARGGRNAETLTEAKRRAPKQLKTFGRAVTAEDFSFFAGQTPGVRVARSVVLPLYRPYSADGVARSGVNFERRAPGALSIVVVPDGTGRFLAPTEGALQTVCRHLNRYRLVTTELYVVAPQYVRLFDLTVTVVPSSGFGRTEIRQAVALHLERYLHVLTGGVEGNGYPFGATLHHSELVAQLFRVPGIERVESVTSRYDGTAPDAAPPIFWRSERYTPRLLVDCPNGADQDTQIVLFPDECVFVDTTSLNVVVHS